MIHGTENVIGRFCKWTEINDDGSPWDRQGRVIMVDSEAACCIELPDGHVVWKLLRKLQFTGGKQ